MDSGCHLPMFGPAATRETVLAFARRIEALGYVETRHRDLDDMVGIYETFAREIRSGI